MTRNRKIFVALAMAVMFVAVRFAWSFGSRSTVYGVSTSWTGEEATSVDSSNTTVVFPFIGESSFFRSVRPEEASNLPTVYSWARTDRSGSVIEDMLSAHAYAFAHNMTYGGACSHQTGSQANFVQRRPGHQELIKTLGLTQTLPFACPPPESPKETFRTIHSKVYRHPRFKQVYWTREWVDNLRASSTRPAFLPCTGLSQVVVHVRRGDVVLCQSKALRNRYDPNSFYLDWLKPYIASPTRYNITIYSEEDSYEDWNDFLKLNASNLQLRLDSPRDEVWNAIMDADIVLVAKSTFSKVPAIFNGHGVSYTTSLNDPWPIFRNLTRYQYDLIDQGIHQLEQQRCA